MDSISESVGFHIATMQSDRALEKTSARGLSMRIVLHAIETSGKRVSGGTKNDKEQLSNPPPTNWWALWFFCKMPAEASRSSSCPAAVCASKWVSTSACHCSGGRIWRAYLAGVSRRKSHDVGASREQTGAAWVASGLVFS